MEVFKLFGSILVDSAAAEKSISKTGDQADGLASKLGNGIKTAGKWAAGIVAGAAAVGAGMIASAKSTASATDVIDKASIRMGIDAEEYQKLSHAAELSGVSMSTMEKAAKELQASGSDLSFDDALDQIMSITDESERAAAAAEMFGDKAAYDMAPLLQSGAEGLAAMKQEAEAMGIVLSNDTVKSGAAMNDAFTKIEESVSSVKNQIGAQFMPMLTAAIDWIVEHLPEIQATVNQVIDFIQVGIEKFSVFWNEHGAAIMEVASTVWNAVKSVIETAINVIAGIIKTVTSIMSGDWEGAWEGIKQIVESVWGLIQEGVELALLAIEKIIVGFGTTLFNAGKSLFTKMWDGIKSVWASISSWVSEKVAWIAEKLSFWKSAKSTMNSSDVDGSHASGLPFVPYDGYVAELHRGETVLNADSASGLLEGIVNGLAAVIGNVGTGGGNYTINLQVDDKTLASVVFDPLKDLIKQKGEALA